MYLEHAVLTHGVLTQTTPYTRYNYDKLPNNYLKDVIIGNRLWVHKK